MEPKLPPDGALAKMPRAQVIDIAKAVTRIAAVPLLDPVKRQMYRDWMRGLRPRQIADVYRCAVYGRPSVDEVDDILRGQAVLERMEKKFKEAA